MTIDQFAQSLYGSELSTNLRETSWIVPTVQSIHIIAIAAVVSAALVMDLRLAGVFATDQSPRRVVKRHLPWMWAGLVVLLLSGLILGYAEPYRVLTNDVFWVKMALVLTGFTLTVLFRYPLLRPDFQVERVRTSWLIRPLAWVSLAIWVVVVFFGRWIAYYY